MAARCLECVQIFMFSIKADVPICLHSYMNHIFLDCGQRTAPDHGVVTIVSGNGYTEGSVIRFDCNPGYIASSPITTTCTTSGTWSNNDDVICSKGIL